MKGKAMTKEEYLALYEEYQTTDSISRREEICEEIYKNAIALFNLVSDIFARYGMIKKLITDDDYRDDRGHLSLAYDKSYYDEDNESSSDAMIYKTHLYLRYSDSWQYGGYCSFVIRLETKWFDIEERKKLALQLKEEGIKKLESENESLKKVIEYNQKMLQANCDRINKFKAEEE
jgi:hypothetical protein